MEWDLSRVYTSVNADEVKVGSKVVCANTIKDLKRKVAENEITEIKGIKDDCYENRFSACVHCIKTAQKDPKYDNYMTDKTFNEKLGRAVILK